ncbi:FtsQ-type POTRA domain-containing protein [Tissierella praeacuta]|uniref:cell division protein FtsQ/DivIB n=1 Tax=Tissierella praeacuta TaxID=43131 RepID=UPI00333FD219
MKKLSRVEKKMRRRRFFFQSLLLISFILLLSAFALNSNLFIIDNIKVLGNNKVQKDNAINVSSINIGENIFKISTRSGEKNLRKLPYIKEVKIKRKFPRGIIIDIIERKAIIQIKEISSIMLLDIEGNILDIVDSEDEKLPLLLGLNIGDKKIGNNIFSMTEIKEGIEFITEGQAAGVLSKMKKIDMVDNNNVNIVLIDGITVAFGTLYNVKYKVSLLNEILKDIEEKQLPCKMILMDRGDNPIIVLNEEGEG